MNVLKKIRLPQTTALYGIVFTIIVFSIWNHSFFAIGNFVNVSRQLAPLAIIAICSFLALMTHHTDLSVGGFMGLAGIVACLLSNKGWNLFAACAVALLCTMFLGMINGIIIAYTTIAPFIVTLAMMGIAQSIASVLGRESLKFANEKFAVLNNADVFGVIPLPFLITVVLYLIIAFILYKRKFGTQLYAIGGREESALASGINVKRDKIIVFTINGLLGGFAGLMFSSRICAANPTFGEGYELQGICSAVLGGTALSGGKGSIGGAFLGALAIQLIRNGMNFVGLNSNVQMITIGVILVIIITMDTFRKEGKRNEK